MDGVFVLTLEGLPPAPSPMASLTVASTPGLTTRPNDTPADAVFEARLIDPGNLERHLFSLGATRGRSQVGFGAITLNNADGGLDDVSTWACDGRALVLRRGPAGAAYPGAFPVLWRGTVEQVEADWRRMTIRLRDRQAEVAEKQLQPLSFAGTNALPDGIEGTPEDLKGRAKPLVWGRVLNLALPMVNTSKLICQISTAPVTALSAVYDKGAALTLATERATLVDLLAATPASGTVDYVLSDGVGAFLRLGSPPVGTVTVDVAAGVAGERSAASVLRALLLGPGGLTAADLDSPSFDALAATAPGEVGLAIDSDSATVGDALDLVAGSIGAWWSVDRLGRFRVGRLVDPAGLPPKLTVTDREVLDRGGGFERIASTDVGGGLPVATVRLGYQRNWSPMVESSVAGIALPRLVWLREELRFHVVDRPAVRARHPLARDLAVTTVLLEDADALAEATRLADLYGIKRDVLSIAVPADRVTGVDPGDAIRVVLPRFGLAAGKTFLVLGMTEEFGRGIATLHLWG